MEPIGDGRTSARESRAAHAEVALGIDAGAWVRAARRARELSQRELAAAASLPCSTVSRAEAGRNAPSLTTFGKLLGAAGYGLTLVDRHGRLLCVDEEHDRIRNRSGSHFPSHLGWGGRPDQVYDPWWWGWNRIAWYDGRNVPYNVFWRRYRAPHLWRDVVHDREIGYLWDDAT